MERVSEEAAAAAGVDEELIRKLEMPISDLDLSVRASNCLESARIDTVGQLVQYSDSDLLKLRSFGRTSLREVKRKLLDLDLDLGMELPEGYQRSRVRPKTTPRARVDAATGPTGATQTPRSDSAMRHRKAGYKLNGPPRTARRCCATWRQSSSSTGRSPPRSPRPRRVQPFVEKIVTKAKKGDLHARRQVISMLGGDRDAFALARTSPKDAQPRSERAGCREAARSRAEGFFDIPRFGSRSSATATASCARPRSWSATSSRTSPRASRTAPADTPASSSSGTTASATPPSSCVIQFVGNEEGPEIGGGGSHPSQAPPTSRTAFAAKLRKESGKTAVAAEEPAGRGGRRQRSPRSTRRPRAKRRPERD